MPIPGSINDLDTNPNNNSPQGSENVGPNANGYIQALGAFIKQLATGVGLAPTSDINMGGKKLTNLGAGSTTSTSTDAITGAQARALAYKVGEVKMWHGAIANIATTWGAGWQLCDGTNGTADLRDRFIVGAGTSYAPGNTGGVNLNTLSIAQLPAHNHAVNDPGHGHVVNDPGHGHGVSDPGHSHSSPNAGAFMINSAGGGNFAGGASPFQAFFTTATATTNIGIQSSGSNISLFSSATGISTQNTGSGSAIENRPPYYALCFIEYTGIGA
ncbi:hypothetical protein CBA19CS91_01875 [Paraburkholderia hospita]|nr:hypothetical protein CBA19CS91_01875 [Paraburkholderia hospita]